MIDVEKMKDILNKRYVSRKKFPKNFVIKKNNNTRKSLVEQDASNCWIFSVINNAYMELWIDLEPMTIKKEIAKFGYNTEEGQYIPSSWSIVAEYLSKKNKKEYILQEINILKQKKILYNLLINKHALLISRMNSDELMADIRDNGIVDNIIVNPEWRHATNITYMDKYIQEFGTRGTSRYNNFKYGYKVFIKMAEQWAIKPYAYFLTEKQW